MDGPRGFRFQGNDLRLDSSTAAVVVALISYGYLKVESGFELVKSRRRGKVATHFFNRGRDRRSRFKKFRVRAN